MSENEEEGISVPAPEAPPPPPTPPRPAPPPGKRTSGLLSVTSDPNLITAQKVGGGRGTPLNSPNRLSTSFAPPANATPAFSPMKLALEAKSVPRPPPPPTASTRPQSAQISPSAIAAANATNGGAGVVASSSSSNSNLLSPHAGGSMSFRTGTAAWKEFENIYSSTDVQNDPLREVLLFPENEIWVSEEPRDLHTITSLLPVDVLTDRTGLDSFVRDCLDLNTTHWTVVRHANERTEEEEEVHLRGSRLGHAKVMASSSDGNLDRTPSPRSLDKMRLTLDNAKLRASQTPTSIESTYIQKPALRFTDKRHDLLAPIALAQDRSSENVISKPFVEQPGIQLLVDCKQLEFQIGEIEPFYCSLALFDIKTKKKLSESLHFELNNNALLHELEMLPPSGSFDRETCVRAAIFNVPENPKGVYFILRINKLLRPDNEKYKEGYIKPKSVKSKDLEKMKKETKELVVGVTQPFAWSAISILDKSDVPISGQIVLDQIYPLSKGGQLSDESICELLANEKEMKQKTRTNFAGKFVMDVRVPPTELPGRLTSSLIPIKPIPDASLPFVKELDDFSLRKRPRLTYLNHLYFYPDACAFKSKHDNFNLLVEVILKADDKDPKAPGLSVVYNNFLGQKLSGLGLSTVVFKEKKTVFADEIKIELPARLGPQHHLLFNFYHVTLDKKYRDRKNAAVLVGHAFLPLYKDNRIVKDVQRSVPIASELPPNYLELPDNQFKWIEAKKCSFTFRTKVLSSLFAQDEALYAFTKVYNSLGDWDFAMGNATVEAISNIKKISPQTIMEYFPVIVNELFQVMCTRQDPAVREAFLSLVFVIQAVDKLSEEKRDRNTLLASYTRFLFKNVPNAKRYVYEEVTRCWLYYLQQKHPFFAQTFNLSWFLFDIIAKSMILRWHECGQFPGIQRASWFPQEFLDSLKELARHLPASQFEMVNIQKLSFPLFLKELSYVINRGVLFEMIYLYVTALDSSDPILAATGKQIFLKVITNFEQYVPLNLPLETHIGQVSDITQDFANRHFLSGLLLNEVASALIQATTKPTLLRQNISILRNLFKKHEVDPRYRQPKRMERVINIYFPYVLAVLEKFSDLKSHDLRQDKEEAIQKEAFDNVWLCFFFVIKHCSKSLIVEWWKKDTQKRHIRFFDLLHHCLTKFKGKSYEEEMAFVVLEMLGLFTETFEEELQLPESPLLEKLLNLLQPVLDCDFPELLLSAYFPFMSYLVNSFAKALFTNSNSSLIEVLSLAILRHCNYADPKIRTAASTLFYLLLLKNFEEVGNIDRISVQSTVSVSRLVGESKLQEYHNLNSSLNAIVQFAKGNAPDMATQVEDLVNQVFSLIRYNTKIAENAFDPELIADLYHKISLSYFNSPNLRITWLNNLSAYHATNGNPEESAQAKINIAYLVVQYLQGTGNHLPITQDTFVSISPNILKEPGLPDISRLKDEGLFQSASNIWSVAGLIKVLVETRDLLEKAGLYELAMEVYSILTLVYKKERMYTELIESLPPYKAMAEKVVEVNKDLRLFSRFYRVGFYGPKTEDLDGKEFIYKRDQKVNLAVFQQQMKDIYSKKVGCIDNIVVLANKEVDREKLDVTKFYVQIGNVEVFLDPNDSNTANRITVFDRNFNINSFIFEAAHAASGKQQTETSQQQKKKIVFKLDSAFPSLRSRLEVIDKQQIILSPIENAIELITERIHKLKVELNSRPSRINSLQQVLQGSVVPMVNEGPLKFCEIFLRKDIPPDTYPEDHLNTLRTALGEFVRACGFAIALNNSLIGPEHKPFHKMLCDNYVVLKAKINEYIETSANP